MQSNGGLIACGGCALLTVGAVRVPRPIALIRTAQNDNGYYNRARDAPVRHKYNI